MEVGLLCPLGIRPTYNETKFNKSSVFSVSPCPP